MKINIQNKFYSSISKYYAEIFPLNPVQLNFVKRRAGELAEKQILDIGCATGDLAFELSQSGVKVTGIDLNEDLLNQATGRGRFRSAQFNQRETEFASPNPDFQVGNMLDLKTDFEPGQFDVVLCFGNTLVHLEHQKQVQQMLEGVYLVLKPGGYFLLQILNYDYILEQQVSELPIIETENIKFIRKYRFGEDSNQIIFQTDLHIKGENQVISNETQLLPLKSAGLKKLLIHANFNSIELFSNFKMEPFGGKHLPLVLSCRKQE